MQVGASNLGAIADAIDFENPRKAFAHALDHVGDKLAGEAVKRLQSALFRRAGNTDDLAVHLDINPGGDGLRELSLWAFDFDGSVVESDLHSIGDRYGQSSNTRHVYLFYQTEQINSPPTFAFFASPSTSIPFGVDSTLTPSPLRIGAISSTPT